MGLESNSAIAHHDTARLEVDAAVHLRAELKLFDGFVAGIHDVRRSHDCTFLKLRLDVDS